MVSKVCFVERQGLMSPMCFGTFSDWGFAFLVPTEPSWHHEHPGRCVCHHACRGWGGRSDAAPETPDANWQPRALQQLEPRLHHSPLCWEGVVQGGHGFNSKGEVQSTPTCIVVSGLFPPGDNVATVCMPPCILFIQQLGHLMYLERQSKGLYMLQHLFKV